MLSLFIVLLVFRLVIADVPIGIVTSSALNLPEGIAIGLGGNLFVSNYAFNNVVRISQNGTLLNTTAVSGQPFGLARDTNGDVYVASDAVIKLHGVTGAVIAVWNDGIISPLAVAVDSQYVYAADQGSNSIVKLTIFGTFVSSFPVSGDPKGVALDAARAIYVSFDQQVRKYNQQGQPLQNFSDSRLGFLRDVAVDAHGNVVVCSDNVVVQFNPAGAVTHVYDVDEPGVQLSGAFGLTLEAETGNLFVVDNRNSRIVIFAPVNVVPSCTTGSAAGNINLALISPDGADLQGLDSDRSFLYFWSVCGTVQFDQCNKLAPQSSVCGLRIPITNGVVVARPTPPIEWQLDSNSSTTTVVGTVMNGDVCGRFGLQSQLIVILKCARTQDTFFQVDDSQVSPTFPVCTYVLTFNTPVVCAETQTSFTHMQKARL